MKSMLRTLCVLSTAWFLAVGFVASGAELQSPGVPAGSIAVPANLTAQEVQVALIKAADGRGWTVAARDDEKVIIRLDQGNWSARITMLYSTKDVQFFSNSTKNGKPKLPENWLKYLKEDVTRILNTASVLKS